MSTTLVIITTLCYALTAVDLYVKDDIGHAIMFAGYALANVGLLMALQ